MQGGGGENKQRGSTWRAPPPHCTSPAPPHPLIHGQGRRVTVWVRHGADTGTRAVAVVRLHTEPGWLNIKHTCPTSSGSTYKIKIRISTAACLTALSPGRKHRLAGRSHDRPARPVLVLGVTQAQRARAWHATRGASKAFLILHLHHKAIRHGSTTSYNNC